MTDNKFESMTVSELKIVCKILHVDINKITKKSDIIAKISDSGYTHDDYLKATDEQFKYYEADQNPEEEIQIEDNTKSDEMVILKMVYNRGGLNVANKAYFSIEEPYKVFSKEIAEEILRLGKDEVRVATPEEVKSFYKV